MKLPGLRKIARRAAGAALLVSFAPLALAQWNEHGGDPQHTAISTVPTLPLNGIRWQTKVDESDPQEPILIHYGSPVITAANTVLVPVRTATGSYRIEARSGSTGAELWERATDFVNAPSRGDGRPWIPSFSPALSSTGALYYQGAGGSVYRVATPDSGPAAPVQISFLPDYAANKAAYDSSVFISTPITSDRAGNVYFGYETTGSAPGGLTSGIARIDASGVATHVSANLASGIGGASGLRLGTNSAPALSLDGSTLYVALKGNGQYLAAINATTLAPQSRIAISSSANGQIIDQSTSSPTVGPDGDVYFGTWSGSNNYRGMLNHYSADLTQAFEPGSFGWDITPSIVPRALVPSYQGVSDYLVMVKYNNYKGIGDGVNKMAILDPNDTQYDAMLQRQVMREVLTIAGVTPDGPPDGAVREWCINTAAVDPFTKSILINSEDGVLYRWDLTTNTFSESVVLQAVGVLEAYTPTAIGPDGTVYAINKATLFAVGVPEPSAAVLLLASGLMIVGSRHRGQRSAGR